MCQSSCWENSSIFFIMEHNCDVLQCIFYCVSISCRQPPLLSSTMSISFNVLKLCLCIGIIIRTKIYNSLVLNKINWNAHLKCKICCLRLSSKKNDTGCMAGNCCQCININAVLWCYNSFWLTESTLCCVMRSAHQSFILQVSGTKAGRRNRTNFSRLVHYSARTSDVWFKMMRLACVRLVIFKK